VAASSHFVVPPPPLPAMLALMRPQRHGLPVAVQQPYFSLPAVPAHSPKGIDFLWRLALGAPTPIAHRARRRLVAVHVQLAGDAAANAAEVRANFLRCVGRALDTSAVRFAFHGSNRVQMPYFWCQIGPGIS
jgi:hypothetical protein